MYKLVAWLSTKGPLAVIGKERAQIAVSQGKCFFAAIPKGLWTHAVSLYVGGSRGSVRQRSFYHSKQEHNS